MPIVLENNSSVTLTTNNFNFSIFCNGNKYELDSESCNQSDNNLLSSCAFEEVPNIINTKEFKNKKIWTLNLSCGKNLYEELENQNKILKEKIETLKENLFFVGSNISTDFLNICDQESVIKFGQDNLCKVDSIGFSYSAKFLCDKFVSVNNNAKKKCFLGF